MTPPPPAPDATPGPTPANPDAPVDEAEAQHLEPPGRLRGGYRRGKDEVERRVSAGWGWIEHRRVEAIPVDLAVSFYERDRDTFASVLGSAIALRLFLFIVPAIVATVGLVMTVAGHDAVTSTLKAGNITGDLAAQISESTDTSRGTSLLVFLGGLWLTLWAGRNLTKVLAACAGGAWRLDGRESRATLRMGGAVSGLVLLLLGLSFGLNRLRDDFGVAVVTTSWVLTGVVLAVAWFAVTLALPRRTRDPGALLPGAVLMGVTLTLLQAFMQLYLPGRISRASHLMGSIGTAIATLGYMFFVGRIMAASLILNAVVWERVGSISELVFALPVLRRIPERFPSVARFFDLAADEAEAEARAAASAAKAPGAPETPEAAEPTTDDQPATDDATDATGTAGPP